MKLTIWIALFIAAWFLFMAAVSRGAAPLHQKPHRSKVIYTRDFLTATHIVGNHYGRYVERWLVNCSKNEGGHGLWVWRDHIAPRHKEDKPGGWLQFFKSTFNSNVKWAFKDAKQRGLIVNVKARSYYEPLGQAIVAGAMYKKWGNPGTWTGFGC